MIGTHDVGAAVTLADRVMAMRPRPGRLDETVEIRLPRPRDPVLARYEEAVRWVMAALDRSLHPPVSRRDPAAEVRAGWW
jgi:sulfonate transport system ATP-binding protein